MRLLKVKKVKKVVWHEVAGGLYDYHTTEKEQCFVVELTQDEYIKTVEALKEKKR